MEQVRELVGAVTTRIRSHFFSSIVLSFIGLNWQPIFYLFVAEKPVNERFLYVEANLVYVWPILVGTGIALIAPWIALAGTWFAIWPLRLIKWNESQSSYKLKMQTLNHDKEIAEANTETLHAQTAETQARTNEANARTEEAEAKVKERRAKQEFRNIVSQLENKNTKYERDTFEKAMENLHISDNEREVIEALYSSNNKIIIRNRANNKDVYSIDDETLRMANSPQNTIDVKELVRKRVLEKMQITGNFSFELYKITDLGEHVGSWIINDQSKVLSV